MIRLPRGTKVYQDRLAMIVILPNGKKIRQGKRVKNTCKLTKDERDCFRSESIYLCIAKVKERLKITTREAIKLIGEEAGRILGKPWIPTIR